MTNDQLNQFHQDRLNQFQDKRNQFQDKRNQFQDKLNQFQDQLNQFQDKRNQFRDQLNQFQDKQEKRVKHNLFLQEQLKIFPGRKKEFKSRNYSDLYKRIRNKLKVVGDKFLMIKKEKIMLSLTRETNINHDKEKKNLG